MQINYNGKNVEVPAEQSLLAFIEAQNLALDGLSAAVDDAIVPKSNYAQFILKENMKVDLFNLVAGG